MRKSVLKRTPRVCCTTLGKRIRMDLISHQQKSEIEMGLKQQRQCQFELKGTEKAGLWWRQVVGLLEFYRTGPQSYLAANMSYPLRKGKYNPEGDLEIIRAAFLVSKGGATTSFSTGPAVVTQSLGGQTAGRAVGWCCVPVGRKEEHQATEDDS